MQNLDFEAGVWAVVTITGGKKYIGAITTPEPELGKSAIIYPAFELMCADMPVQAPNGDVGFRRLVRAGPIDGCRGPAKVRVIPQGLHFFSEMQEPDQIEHKNLVTSLVEALMRQRLADAGITVPKVQMPSGPLRSS